jgi:tRNA threonylcarbamoyladenosine biosynthesis protein TsaB
MNLLALDTSSIACSAALQFGEALVERHEERPREHTRLLMPMIREILGEASASLGDLDAIVLGNGPGSFIGLRIAGSVAQGLAFGSGLDIVPVSSLAAVAAQVFDEHVVEEVLVTQDAHMHEVYLGHYRRGEDGLPIPVSAERLQGMSRLEHGFDTPPIAAGFGWRRYPELLATNEDLIERFIPVLHPRARYLLALGATGLRSGAAVDPKALNPAYLRQNVAEKPASAP